MKRTAYKPIFFIVSAIIFAFFGNLPLSAKDDVEKEPLVQEDDDIFLNVGEWTLPDPVFKQEDVLFLPNGKHVGSLLEYWFPPVILSNPDAGGFSMLERQNIAVRGESSLWQKYYINGQDVTNPAVPGTSLIYVPQHLWQALALQSVLTPYSNLQGINWILKPEKNPNRVSLSNPGFLGGDSWMGTSTFDREPAQSWGADPKRRRFGFALEGDVFYALDTPNDKPVFLFYEGIIHKRTFTNLNDYEAGYRNSVYASRELKNGDKMNLFYQGTMRDYAQIETGFDSSLATNGGEHSLYGDWFGKRKGWDLGMNSGYYYSRYEQNNPEIMVWGLTDEVLYGKAPVPENLIGWFVGTEAEKNNVAKVFGMPLLASLNLRIEGTTAEPLYAGGVFARTYKDQSHDMTIYDHNGAYSQFITRLYPTATVTKNWAKWVLNVNAGAMFETGSGETSILITRLAPTGGIDIIGKLRKWTLQAGFLHDAVPLTMSEVTFLNPGSPSGGRYFWNDNGDGIAKKSEAGTKINRTGGIYHSKVSDLKTPQKEELYLRSTFHATPQFDLALSAHGKIFRNLYTVNFPTNYDDGYYSISRSGIEGGKLYNRDPDAFGTERYKLDNETSNGYYAAIQFQALKYSNPKSPWFLNFTVGAFYSEAVTVQGNGPDYNDMGAISESSADPNSKLNTRARTDFDRAYVSTFIFGFRFFRELALTNVLRYRDGQPFGEMVIAEGLSQGPTVVQNMERSQPPLGMPRFTYALTWDVRLSFDKVINNKRLGIYFDIYNLLDSRSEIAEHTIKDEKWRNALEMVIGRSYRLSVSYAW
ncbi:MAG: hypothetical protein ABUK01_00945 [Leptospirales bacterium]